MILDKFDYVGQNKGFLSGTREYNVVDAVFGISQNERLRQTLLVGYGAYMAECRVYKDTPSIRGLYLEWSPVPSKPIVIPMDEINLADFHPLNKKARLNPALLIKGDPPNKANTPAESELPLVFEGFVSRLREVCDSAETWERVTTDAGNAIVVGDDLAAVIAKMEYESALES